MKLSLNWIKEFVDISRSYSAVKLAELLTLRTCEVEEYEDQGRGLENVVVGEMLEFKKHPDAEKLSVAKVDIGRKEPLNLIFGQMVKMNVGDRIPVAIAPAVLPTGIKIEAKFIRGVKSEGMLCLEQELGFKKEGGSLLYFPKTKPGTPLAEALGMTDTIFEIDNKSLTHRPDLWGHYGMAREFAAFLGKKLRDFVARNDIPAKGTRASIKVEGRDLAARVLSVIITGIKIEPSPAWMQARLSSLGMRPVNNIVDITNYVMLELGHPTHAFDRRVVGNDAFVIRFARQGETIETLDHKKRTLTSEDMLVTNGERVLGIGGVMGGLNSEITNDTTEIILEEACWNPITLRKTSQRLGLRSDAAQRFEKSLDPELTGIAFHRACELIMQICPTACFAGPATDYYPAKARVRKPVSVLLSAEKVCKKIGVAITEQEMKKNLDALGFAVKKAKKGFLKVTIPTFRATKDINIEDDLVEEVARMHGYEKIPPILPSLPIRLAQPNHERVLKHEARDILSLGLGLNETTHYSFYGQREIDMYKLPREAHITITNPLSADQTHLRISLIPNLMNAVAKNLDQRPTAALYEIGRTYIKRDAFFPQEEKYIAGVIAKNGEQTFYETLGAVRTFLEKLHVKDIHANEPAVIAPYAHPTACASVFSGSTEIGAVYDLHPEIARAIGLKATVFASAFEINFSRLASLNRPEPTYRSIPRFPGIRIDVSVLVERQTQMLPVQELIARTSPELIADIALIDIFEDASLGTDKKSFTFRILLQSPERTLTEEEMRTAQKKIVASLRSGGFSIRG